jgi:hypothetical protein
MADTDNTVITLVPKTSTESVLTCSGLTFPRAIVLSVLTEQPHNTGTRHTVLKYMSCNGSYTVTHPSLSTVCIVSEECTFEDHVTTSLIRVRSLPCYNRKALDWLTDTFYNDPALSDKLCWADGFLPCMVRFPKGEDGTFSCACTAAPVLAVHNLNCWKLCHAVAYSKPEILRTAAECSVPDSLGNIFSLEELLSGLELIKDKLYQPSAGWFKCYNAWVDTDKLMATKGRQMYRLVLRRNAFFVYMLLLLARDQNSPIPTEQQLLDARLLALCSDTTITASCCIHNWAYRLDLQPHLPLLFLYKLITSKSPFYVLCKMHCTAPIHQQTIYCVWTLLCETKIVPLFLLNAEELLRPFFYGVACRRKSDLINCIIKNTASHMIDLFGDSLSVLLDFVFVDTDCIFRFLQFVETTRPMFVPCFVLHLNNTIPPHLYGQFLKDVYASISSVFETFIQNLNIEERRKMLDANICDTNLMQMISSTCKDHILVQCATTDMFIPIGDYIEANICY